MRSGAQFAGFRSFIYRHARSRHLGSGRGKARLQGPGRRIRLGIVQSLVQLLQLLGDEPLELVGGFVDRFGQGSGIMAGENRGGAGQSGLQAALLVPSTRPGAIEIT